MSKNSRFSHQLHKCVTMNVTFLSIKKRDSKLGRKLKKIPVEIALNTQSDNSFRNFSLY